MPDPIPCRACGRPIIFVQTKNNRPMPLDAEPDPHGRIYLIDGVAQIIVPRSDPATWPEERYTSHFATCAEAKRFRKKR